MALSREERGILRHGRVAWLTAFQPITVAGPRPIHTAFPASLACKLKFECMPCEQECQLPEDSMIRYCVMIVCIALPSSVSGWRFVLTRSADALAVKTPPSVRI